MSFYSLYIARAMNAQGHIIGYLWRGKLVERADSAKIYTSPSAAQRAIDRAVHLAAGWVVQQIKSTKMPTPSRGGSRPGAGRPHSVEPLQPVRLRLSEADIVLADTIGQGNRTAGIRLALRQYAVNK